MKTSNETAWRNVQLNSIITVPVIEDVCHVGCHTLTGHKGNVSFPQLTDERLLEVTDCRWMKTVTNRMQQQKSACDCFGC